jgi:hypothetical protein
MNATEKYEETQRRQVRRVWAGGIPGKLYYLVPRGFFPRRPYMHYICSVYKDVGSRPCSLELLSYIHERPIGARPGASLYQYEGGHTTANNARPLNWLSTVDGTFVCAYASERGDLTGPESHQCGIAKVTGPSHVADLCPRANERASSSTFV